jgi:hypothetical protein
LTVAGQECQPAAFQQTGKPRFRRKNMAERKRTRRNTLERRCLGKAFKRLFNGSTKGVFKMLEKVKKA